MAVIGQFLQRFGTGARFGVAAVCGLALMTVPVLAQFGQFGGRGQSFELVFQPIFGAALPGRTLDRLQPCAFAEEARRSADRRQRAGAGRFHGRLAGLWTGGRARRPARSGCRAEEPRQQRIDPLRLPQREGGLGAGDPRNDRRDQAEVRRHDGRAERSRLDPRSRGAVDPACGCRGEERPCRPPRPPRNSRRLRPTQSPRPRTPSRRRATSR